MSSTRIFHIYTIVNRMPDYREMRDSFVAGGFDECSSAFTMLDNTEENRHDPYQILGRIIGGSPERYIILCHQDVRLMEGQTRGRLEEILDKLEQRDPRWMVAGNSGFDSAGEPVLHLNDPGDHFRYANLPKKVFSMDENFLVIKAGCGLKSSIELKGFHLYGTDLCLNAYKQGGSAYVIDFLVKHLSRGNFASTDYVTVLRAFEGCWRKQLIVGLVRTTGTQTLLSSNRLFEWLLPRYGTIAQFLWDIRRPLFFGSRHCSGFIAAVFALGIIPASVVWRLALRRHFCRGTTAEG